MCSARQGCPVSKHTVAVEQEMKEEEEEEESTHRTPLHVASFSPNMNFPSLPLTVSLYLCPFSHHPQRWEYGPMTQHRHACFPPYPLCHGFPKRGHRETCAMAGQRTLTACFRPEPPPTHTHIHTFYALYMVGGGDCVCVCECVCEHAGL